MSPTTDDVASHIASPLEGRVKMKIGSETYTIEEGDTYFHPLRVLHQHETRRFGSDRNKDLS